MPTSSNICDHPIISRAISPEGNLQYDVIFESPQVIASLSFAWLYRELFGGIYPSKIVVDQPESYEACFKYFETKTFYRLVPPQEVQKIFKEKQAGYDAFRASLNSKQNVKKELFFKLRDRICPHLRSSPYNDKVTLFQSYIGLVGASSPSKFYENEKLHIVAGQNPITGFSLNITPKLPNTISRWEHATHIFTQDNYWLRLLFSACKIVIIPNDEDVPSFQGFNVFNPTMIITTSRKLYECALKQCANVFCCADIAQLVHCMPKLAIAAIFATSTTPPFPTISRTSNTTATIKPNMKLYTMFGSDENETQAYDMNIASQVQTAFGSTPTVPMPVQDYMCRIYERTCEAIKKKWMVSAQTDLTSKNCVFIIDNRKNILTVMATYITLSNLKSDSESMGSWNAFK